jgi:hypothetical protein
MSLPKICLKIEPLTKVGMEMEMPPSRRQHRIQQSVPAAVQSKQPETCEQTHCRFWYLHLIQSN